MNAHVNLVDSELLADGIEQFFAPVSHDLIDGLVSEFETKKARIIAMAEAVNSDAMSGVLHYFVEGNTPDGRHTLPRTVEELFGVEGAVGKLLGEFWHRALLQTDVIDYMPQKRREEWFEQIRHPLGRKESRYGDRGNDLQPLPEFNDENVRATLGGLLVSRAKFFAERVDGIFQSLSRSHITNQPQGFSKRMIIANVLDTFGVSSSKAGVINDLRCVIAKFMGRDEPKYGATDAAIKSIRRDNGVWRSIDGNALRMRVYNGAGTAHLEVHPDMAWRLNAVLASMYPAAIPAEFREKPERKRKVKDFELFDRPLPFAVIDVLANMEQARELIKDAGYRENKWRKVQNALQYSYSGGDDKHTMQEVTNVLRAIGGVWQKIGATGHWQFDYDPTDVVGEIVCSGCIPDHKSHQFYPTPEKLAVMAVEWAAEGSEPDMHWLEPSAGTGGLADHVPEDAYLQCYEISELHCKVLEAKGYQAAGRRAVACLDFLKLAADYRGGGYHRIVMNPPFSEGRWQAHLEGAAKMLRKGGRLVAVLPASASGKTLIDGYVHKYSNPHSNLFSGASVTVVILTLDRPD